jgi:hypothetical protein
MTHSYKSRTANSISRRKRKKSRIKKHFLMKYMPNVNVVKPTGYYYIFKNKLEANREKKDNFL